MIPSAFPLHRQPDNSPDRRPRLPLLPSETDVLRVCRRLPERDSGQPHSLPVDSAICCGRGDLGSKGHRLVVAAYPSLHTIGFEVSLVTYRTVVCPSRDRVTIIEPGS